MPIDEACSYVRSLYVMAKFDGQPVFRVLVDNGTILNVLLVSMLRKLSKKKSDMLLIDLIRTNFMVLQLSP